MVDSQDDRDHPLGRSNLRMLPVAGRNAQWTRRRTA
jgi:hypothetical protein